MINRRFHLRIVSPITLQEWLINHKSTHKFKIIASPVTWSNDSPDIDNFYSSDREWLLNFMEGHHICGVVILSGDTHYGAAYKYSDLLHEISASPFQAIALPYPGCQYYCLCIMGLRKYSRKIYLFNIIFALNLSRH
jgi:hypothetical protein